jgi:hypothetical protein
MTPEELLELIRNGPTSQMVSALAPLEEKQRKKLAKAVVDFRKGFPVLSSSPLGSALAHLSHTEIPGLSHPDIQGLNRARGMLFAQDRGPVAVRLKLALLAVGPWAEAQRIRVWHVAAYWQGEEADCDHLFCVLLDRRPDWLAKWVEKELEERMFSDWPFVRRLVRAGLCPRPEGENYIVKMLQAGLLRRTQHHGGTLKDALLDDPELLTWEVWKIFELSPVRETVLWANDPASPYSWGGALAALCREGKLDRNRLLEASLAGLLRNMEARNTGSFASFHELLEPTEEERHRLQPTYLQLLAHQVPPVVGMALAALARLEKAQKMDVPGFLQAVPAVFYLQPKAHPLAALRLLARLCSRDIGQQAMLAEALLTALPHPAADVQQRAVELLEKISKNAPDIVRSCLPERLDQLVPSVQEKARQLLDKLQPRTEGASREKQIASHDTLIEEARKLPACWREQAGIDVVLEALETGATPPPLAFDPMRIPRLYTDNRLVPIQTLDELIDRLIAAVTKLDSGIEFELLLDGLSRLCDQRPADFEDRVAPIPHAFWSALPRGFLATIETLGLRAPLVKLIFRWCGGNFPGPVDFAGKDLFCFLDLRLYMLARRVQKQQAAPLLACPTHRQGWVEAGELIRRLAWYQQHGMEPDIYDFIQALLRLAPDGRAEALAASAALQGKHVAAVRFALGGPLENPTLPAPILIAAGRARTPLANLSELELIIGASGPDALRAASYSWFMDHSEPENQPLWARGREPVERARVRVSVVPDIPAIEKVREMPSVLLHSWRILDYGLPGGRESLHRWAASLWPANLDPFFAAGLCVPRTSFMVADLLRQRALFLEPLFDPDVRFTEMAQVLLALALTQKEPEVAGSAIDVMIELIRDGRCTGTELGSVFACMLPSGLIKLNRLGNRLENVARASLLHTHVCAGIIQAACSAFTEVPRDFHHLLSPLLEWLTVLEQDLNEPFRALVAKAKSGKSGMLAQKLMRLQRSSSKRREILLQVLQYRTERARRWESAAP